MEWISNIPDIPALNLPEYNNSMLSIQDGQHQNVEIIRSVKPPSGEFTVLAVDFEFHNHYSYDGKAIIMTCLMFCYLSNLHVYFNLICPAVGFISVASVSTPSTTLVVDCLNDNRKFAIKWMSKLLEGRRCLKVLHGCSNDIFRLRKDWQCFPNGVVDLQDLFVVWKNQSFSEALTVFWEPIKSRLLQKKSSVMDSEIQQYLRDLNTPGLGILVEGLFPGSPIDKAGVKSFADWRHRPIHSDLLDYSAKDSFYTLRVFHSFFEKVKICSF